ncbi:hypothetical protein QYF61_018177 [Mycteria americana]|uniref:Uncharacterized protein n=1 Tax=Mycteria americana TaxID=33587 RepID=A0AAN7NMA1_MYCAM|nr:hypothetical protein QYF61_018177 [Mycteria americana]
MVRGLENMIYKERLRAQPDQLGAEKAKRKLWLNTTTLNLYSLSLKPLLLDLALVSRHSTPGVASSLVRRCVQFWSPQFKEDTDRLDRVQRRATKMIKRLENLPYEDRLRRSFLLGEEKARGNLTTVSQYLKGDYKDGGSLITGSHMEKTYSNGCKLHWERFHLYVRKEFFTVRTTNHWNNLPRDVGESPSLEVFKM